MKITRTLAVAAAAVAAVALSACESSEPAGVGTSSSAAKASQNATQAPGTGTVEPAAAPSEAYKAPSLDEIAEQAYLNTVAPYTYPSEDEALMVGYATCALLNTGSTPATLAAELLVADGPVVPGFSNDELPHFYGAAMGSLCPEYGERFFG